jgi:hypothetical protein
LSDGADVEIFIRPPGPLQAPGFLYVEIVKASSRIEK